MAGPPAGSVTSTAATGPTSSPRTSTVGSGRPTRLASLPLAAGQLSTTGAPPGASTHGGPSRTTGSRSSRAGSPSPAWPSSTTSTETVSSGTTWPVTMRNPSSVRTWRDIWLSPGKPSPTSEYPEESRSSVFIINICYLLRLRGSGGQPGVNQAASSTPPVSRLVLVFNKETL